MNKPNRVITSDLLQPFIFLYHTALATNKGKRAVEAHDPVVLSIENINNGPALIMTAHGKNNRRKVWIFHCEEGRKGSLQKENYSIIYGDDQLFFTDVYGCIERGSDEFLKRKSGYHYPHQVIIPAIHYLNTGIIGELDTPQ